MTAAELRAEGVYSRDIQDAMDGDALYRVAKGIYTTLPEVLEDPRLDDALAVYRTGGVIGHLSAAMRHDLCDVLPPMIEILVPWETTRPPVGMPVRLIRTRNPEALTAGVETEDFFGFGIRMTSPGRTVVDLYRIDPLATRQHALASLTRYLRDSRDINELEGLARQFGVHDVMRPEIDAVQETLEQGFRP